MKKIIHLDMDAFFASIEQRDNPELKGKPVIVGGDPKGRGVVATASYEARKFGIRSAMSCKTARTLCPDAIFIRPRFEVYRTVSQEIQAIMHRLSDKIEPLGLDEAFLDVSDQPFCHGSATLMANWLRQEIFEKTALTASAGVSFNKMLAKIASDLNKPNGTATISPKDAPAFLDTLAIEKFFGIGRATATAMHAMGIHTGADLKAANVSLLVEKFGKRGQFYFDIAHGRDERDVKSRVRKSIGSEITLSHDTKDPHAIERTLIEQATRAFSMLEKQQKYASCVTLKLKYQDFSQITRSATYPTAFECVTDAITSLKALLSDTPKDKAVRLVGVSFSNFQTKSTQMALF